MGSIKAFKLCSKKINLRWTCEEKRIFGKRIFGKIFLSVWNFLKLQCLVDDLVDSLELLRFIYAYIQYIIWWGG